MKLPILHESLAENELFLQGPGLFSGAKLIAGQNPIRKSGRGRTYTYTSLSGKTLEIELKQKVFLDPIPALSINGVEQLLVPKLLWYEWCWIAVPAILVFTGGGLGALIGITAVYSSTRIFRSDAGASVKYSLSLLCTGLAFAIFFLAAIALQALIHGKSNV